MKILFLYNNKSRDLRAKELINWLQNYGENVVPYTNKLDLEDVSRLSPDMIISYGYKHILKKEVLSFPEKGCINLHISYLPYNRGIDPNIWSFLEDTPKGVTIHYMDEGVDTGDIIVQKEVFLDEDKETLRSSYQILQVEIVNLFKENWEKIKAGQIRPKSQGGGGGSIHYCKGSERFTAFISKRGWDMPVREFKKRFTTNCPETGKVERL